MKMHPSARGVATHVLHRVATEDAWATPTLDAAVKRARLDARDAALATQIALGALRVVPSLDAAIDALVKRPPDPFVRAVLRACAFQIRHLARVPARAAVNEAVTVARTARGPKVAGFVNAVARKLAKTRPEAPRLPTHVELPSWIHAAIRESVGEARAAALLQTREPTIDLRAADPDSLAETIRAARPDAEVELLASGLRVTRAGDPRKLPGYAEGRFAVQELGAQRIAGMVEARPGMRVADLCAGRGGKTTALAEAVGREGEVVAVELHEQRLEQIPEELARLRLDARVSLETVDLTVGTGGLGTFDRVLVDAPCTGFGTLQRRPEIALRAKPEDVGAMVAVQEKILRTATEMLAPGGRLVYAVCSPLREEALTSELPAIEVPGADEDRVLRLGPWDDPATDAYQIRVSTRPS